MERTRLYKDGERNPKILEIYKVALIEGKELCSVRRNNTYWIMFKNKWKGKTLICQLVTKEMT